MTSMIESHPLQFPWTFTFFKKAANKGYEENTSTLGTTESVRRARPSFPLAPSCHMPTPCAAFSTAPTTAPSIPPPLFPGRGLLASLRPPAEASRRPADRVRLPCFPRGDQADVGGRVERERGQVDRQIEKGRRRSLLGRPGAQPPRPSLHDQQSVCRPSPQCLRGRSSSRCWGGSSRWGTRSAGRCSPCATRKTSSPSGPLQPQP